MAANRSTRRDMKKSAYLMLERNLRGEFSWYFTQPVLRIPDSHTNLPRLQWYASYISSYVWAALFLAPKLRQLWKNRKDLTAFRTDRLK